MNVSETYSRLTTRKKSSAMITESKNIEVAEFSKSSHDESDEFTDPGIHRSPEVSN